MIPASTRALYNRLSAVYDTLADASERDARERGLALLAASSGDRVLEIGCGTGHALTTLAGQVAPDGCVVGVDVSEGMLRVASTRLGSRAHPSPVWLVQGDARSLPCVAHRFDAAFLSFTLELFEADDRLAVLAELARVLRPGGRLGVVSLSEPSTRRPVVEVYRWLHRHFPHLVDCQPIDVGRILQETGWRIARLGELEMWGMPVAMAVAEVVRPVATRPQD